MSTPEIEFDIDAMRRTEEIGRQLSEELWGEGNLDLIDNLYAKDAVIHAAGWPEDVRGRAAIREYVGTLQAVFTTEEATVEDIVADEATCATRYSFRGTHDGELFGIEPTGRTVEGSGVSLIHVEDGMVVEEWDFTDVFGIMQQIGAVDMAAE